jgi:hypothetical protein
LKSCKKKNKFASQHFFLDPALLYLKKQTNIAVHIIIDINYYENSTKAVNLNHYLLPVAI